MFSLIFLKMKKQEVHAIFSDEGTHLINDHRSRDSL